MRLFALLTLGFLLNLASPVLNCGEGWKRDCACCQAAAAPSQEDSCCPADDQPAPGSEHACGSIADPAVSCSRCDTSACELCPGCNEPPAPTPTAPERVGLALAATLPQPVLLYTLPESPSPRPMGHTRSERIGHAADAGTAERLARLSVWTT
ncbi:MAG: hypothetical protein IBJ11_02645 [Phycisphaerales bacterium]|nr:hypothetical protein [Phycisphaerales bacterium]